MLTDTIEAAFFGARIAVIFASQEVLFAVRHTLRPVAFAAPLILVASTGVTCPRRLWVPAAVPTALDDTDSSIGHDLGTVLRHRSRTNRYELSEIVIEKREYDIFSKRVSLSTAQKMSLAAGFAWKSFLKIGS